MTEIARSLDFNEESASSMPGVGEPLKVVLRIRPLTEEEEARGEEIGVEVDPEDGTLSVQCRNRNYHKGSIREAGKANFQFSTIFDPDCGQESVFSQTAKPLIQKLFNGGQGLIFAYGTTNAGKTYTIQGQGASNPGVIHLTVRMILDILSGRNTDVEVKDNVEFELGVSFMEIYNEQCFDLLDRSSAKDKSSLRVKENVSGAVHVEGLRVVAVSAIEQVEAVLAQGIKRRRVAETVQNDRSSRSHAIFTVHLKQFVGHTAGLTELVSSSSLAIVDLAGSERSGRALNHDRERVRESSQINKSLMNLARCLEVLRENQKRKDAKKLFVPYRQSRLTRLFQPSLESGSAVMIANISPLLRDSDETIHALSCAALACQVQVGVAASFAWNKENLYSESKTPRAASILSELAREHRRNAFLEEEIRRLQVNLSKAESRLCIIESEVREEAATEMEEALAEMEEEYSRRLEGALETNEKRVEKRIELITNTARKNLKKRAEVKVDEATVAKYKEWLKDEVEVREFQEQLHSEERQELLERLEELEEKVRKCHCTEPVDISKIIDAT